MCSEVLRLSVFFLPVSCETQKSLGGDYPAVCRSLSLQHCCSVALKA